MRRSVHAKGLSILDQAADIIHSCNYHYACAYGTLLGFVRESGFIAHDNDIDIVLLGKNGDWQAIHWPVLHEALCLQGFTFLRGFTYGNDIVEVSYAHSGVQIDFFVPYTLNGVEGGLFLINDATKHYPDDSCRTAIHVPAPLPASLTKITIEGYQLSIPSNAEEILESIYGPGWKVPDDKWDGSHRSNRTELLDFAHHFNDEAQLYDSDRKQGQDAR